jgi:hypothetical protein
LQDAHRCERRCFGVVRTGEIVALLERADLERLSA